LIFLLQASTPDVSSTAIRERLRRGEPLAGLVPPLVETHIHQHHLYPHGQS
jgi:nicotinate-nucleotide adenylyltransferase